MAYGASSLKYAVLLRAGVSQQALPEGKGAQKKAESGGNIKYEAKRGERSFDGRMNYVKSSRLYRELSWYQDEGIQLWLDGRPSTSYYIADRLCEKSNYMRDYYMDCQNQICGIGFDRIREHNQQTEIPQVQNLK